jgi:hypothetical protein
MNLQNIDESELVISLYHPQIFHLYTSYKDLILKKMYPKFSDNAKKMFETLGQLDKGVSPDGFKLRMESLGFASDFVEALTQKFTIYYNLTEDNYASLYNRAKTFIADEIIREAAEKYNLTHNVDEFVASMEAIKFNDIDNKFADEKLFSTCLFGDIDVAKEQETFVKESITSSLNVINTSNPQGGYTKGQMVVIAAPTKCLVGTTEICIGEEENSVKIQDLIQFSQITVKCYDENINDFHTTIGLKPRITGYRDLIVQITLNNSKTMQCTPDHLFLMADHTYKQAQSILPTDNLMCEKDILFITDIQFIKLEEPIPVYDLTVPEYSNYKLACGAYVHNCGKSMVAMQETAKFLSQGLNVVYAALGDLKKYDFLYRMSSQINHKPMPYTTEHLIEEVNTALDKVPELKEHLDLQLLAPDAFNAKDYVNYVKNAFAKDGQTLIHDWADVIIIDYDSNFESSADSMYTKGENIYQTLYQLVYPDKLVILMAQTNKASWGTDVITVGELGESSRKQQIVDILLTISNPPCKNTDNQVGVMNLCAGRRCKKQQYFYFRDIDGYFYDNISSNLYEHIKEAGEPKTMIKDIKQYGNSFKDYNYLGEYLYQNNQVGTFVQPSLPNTNNDCYSNIDDDLNDSDFNF